MLLACRQSERGRQHRQEHLVVRLAATCVAVPLLGQLQVGDDVRHDLLVRGQVGQGVHRAQETDGYLLEPVKSDGHTLNGHMDIP
jgi:hypothetical protein